jgi:hypothetical protein
LHLIVHTS